MTKARQLAILVFTAGLVFDVSVFADAPSPSAPSAPVKLVRAVPTEIAASANTWIDGLKSVTQIVFWVVIATLAILTYLRARKTLLQPLRTEIFKVQLEEMKSILSLFVGRGEIELRAHFAFDHALQANTARMYDEYAYTFFDVETDHERRPYGDGSCPGMRVSEKSFEKYGEVMDGHLKDDEARTNDPEARDPRVRAALWNEYGHGTIHIPKAFLDMQQRITDLLENPMLPSGCVELLKDYLSTAEQNLGTIETVLTEAAEEMPSKYPSLDDLSKSTYYWIHTRYVRESTDLKPKADAIVGFVRAHYDVDTLLRE